MSTTTQEARDLLFARDDVFGLRNAGDPRAAEVAAKMIGELDPTQPIPWTMQRHIEIVSQTRDPHYIPVLLPFLEQGPSVTFGLLTHLAFLGAPEALARLQKIADSKYELARSAQGLLNQLRKTE